MAQPVKLRARIGNIETHAPGLRTFTLETERRVPRFKPGQFLHLAVARYDPSRHWPDSRCFSIASPTTERKKIKITVSRVGKLTAKLFELEVGATVWVKLPYGDFTIDADDGNIIVVAGGTGIAPFMSLFGGEEIKRGSFRVLYGAAKPELLIYADQLDAAKKVWPDFFWRACIEEGERDNATMGRISVDLVLEMAGQGNNTFYLSGPPLMIQNIRDGLIRRNIAPSAIRVDAWD